ncbi:putative carB [Escherichia coli 2788150]|nr:putative carB [Escherichia coli 2788150]
MTNCLMLHELWLQSGTARRWEDYRRCREHTAFSPQKEVTGGSGVTRMYRCGGTVCVTTSAGKTMPFDLLTVLPPPGC